MPRGRSPMPCRCSSGPRWSPSWCSTRGKAVTARSPAPTLPLHLARHGVKAEVHHSQVEDISVGDALLSRLADDSSDLLVMGAYGHSRLRELVLGGVTRTLLDHMTVPVFMSH